MPVSGLISLRLSFQQQEMGTVVIAELKIIVENVVVANETAMVMAAVLTPM